MLNIGGKSILLIIKVGMMLLCDENNEFIVLFGFISYIYKNGGVEWFIVFVYNGGLGFFFFWFYMGVLGFKCIVVNDFEFMLVVFYVLVNNEYLILDIVDLVMIDFVGIGLSVFIGKVEFKDFWGVD